MDKQLRIIFMGTPEFAVAPLEALLKEGWQVVAVITAVDKPQGRGRKPRPSPVKECALRHGIPVLQPPNLKNKEFLSELATYQADLQVVVAFRMLPEVVWSMPPKGTFNLHASLLPDYRGAAPINWVLINGETKTGVTTFFLQQEIDTGNILFQEEEPIHPEDNAGSLYERLMQRGARLVVKTVEAIATNNVQPKKQDHHNALHQAPKIFKETCEIDWSQPAIAIHHLVRGLSPYPGARCLLNGKSCKVFKTEVLPQEKTDLKAGEFKTDNKTYIHFQTGKGVLSLLEVQLEGKRKMDVQEYLRGNPLI
ncbi:MAG: methionyl-tRNA formyltransferase [Cyclobacterium sp.]|uniref:methionyl-tRNA formyltransferase n=1 Tax=unclassified Cyclobacterium TaxID=2615055 RepID=UPI0013D55AEC|nr:methionyl-tRNA formyltransferase [Cyclobacterium sp. SYSU L10401]